MPLACSAISKSWSMPTGARKSPKLYLADAGLLCALLNIRSEKDLRQSPAAGAVWETFVFAQLRARARREERVQSLFFWRDRTREVDFVVDVGGRLELFEAAWNPKETFRIPKNPREGAHTHAGRGARLSSLGRRFFVVLGRKHCIEFFAP